MDGDRRAGPLRLHLQAGFDEQPVAGALNLIGPDALYGRYWGAVEERPALGIELEQFLQLVGMTVELGVEQIDDLVAEQA